MGRKRENTGRRLSTEGEHRRFWLKIGTQPADHHEVWKSSGVRWLWNAPEVGGCFGIRENGERGRLSHLYVEEIKVIAGEPLYLCSQV